MTDEKAKNVEINSAQRKIQVDDEVMYKNILGEWHQGTVIKVNNTTIRILNKREFKILSLKWENVYSIDEFEAMQKA